LQCIFESTEPDAVKYIYLKQEALKNLFSALILISHAKFKPLLYQNILWKRDSILLATQWEHVAKFMLTDHEWIQHIIETEEPMSALEILVSIIDKWPSTAYLISKNPTWDTYLVNLLETQPFLSSWLNKLFEAHHIKIGQENSDRLSHSHTRIPS
jgi:hypothetical protein